VQSAWFDARAWAASGRVWDDGPLHWSDGPDGGNLVFPESIPSDALARGLARGLAELGRRPVGAGSAPRCWPRCSGRRGGGARSDVLNATPLGFALCSRRGFTRVGEGITWWLHR
jgi:hypothetical protein